MSESSPFEAAGPYEEQRELFEVLSQETRHLIVQTVLGHPDHLPSLDELTYFVRKSKSATLDGLDVLMEHDIVAKYEHEPSEQVRDLPANFYGPTEHGIEVLAAYNYLGMVPALRAVYDSTEKTEKVIRHQRAPRPDLPAEVRDALSFVEPEIESEDDGGDDDESVVTVSLPVDKDVEATDTELEDDTTSLDNLFRLASDIERAGEEMQAIDPDLATMDQLHNRLEEIKGSVDEFAERVSTLALNAAIEAARAGEAGEGYAVVVEEVNALAKDTRETAREIDTLIEDLDARSAKPRQQVIKEIGQAIDDIERMTDSIRGIAAGLATNDSATVQPADKQVSPSIVDPEGAEIRNTGSGTGRSARSLEDLFDEEGGIGADRRR